MSEDTSDWAVYPEVTLRLECECGRCHRYLDIWWEEWLSLKAHYHKKDVMIRDCECYKRDDYYIIELSKRWKVVGYG